MKYLEVEGRRIPALGLGTYELDGAEVFDFTLSDAEMAMIHGLAREQRIIDPSFAPRWERAGV